LCHFDLQVKRCDVGLFSANVRAQTPLPAGADAATERNIAS
jgi:hypothetical protein